jgi:tetratricopeptide (TPR) repeat protein
MPSLANLQEFKSSFRTIAGEPVSLAQANIPLDDLELPANEPVPLPEESAAAQQLSGDTGPEIGDNSGDMDLDFNAGGTVPGLDDLDSEWDLPGITGDAALVTPEASAGGDDDAGPDFDFSAFLNTIPDTLTTPEPAPLPVETAPEGAAVSDLPDTGDTGVSGDTDTPDLNEDGAVDSAFPDIEADAPADLAFPGLNEDVTMESAFSDMSADFPGDAAMEGLLNGFADDIESAKPDGNTAGMEAVSGEAVAGDLDGLDLKGESTDPGSIEPGGGSAADIIGSSGDAAFDGFQFDDSVLAAGAGEAAGSAADTAAPVAGTDDFFLSGIDDVLAGISGTETPTSKAGTQKEAAGDTVEEIQLSEADFEKLQNTLASFPLNLRIAIEELIAEQAVAPDLMSSLIKLLARGGSAKEAASLAGKILGKPISIPKGFEKKTGEAMEAEQATFSYIFAHKFLPILRIAFAAAIVAVSLMYLIYEFIYTPLRAKSVYKAGYERIFTGDYARANNRFSEAFSLHRDKKWFYRYAEAFRDQRQYIYAEQKYDDLLRYYPRDKKGALDYAYMETNYQRNYDKADRIIRNNILDYKVNDTEGLVALGDNNMLWGEIDPTRYEEARRAYAMLLEQYGWKDPFVERMLRYFIRTDNLKEVLPLQQYFMEDSKKKISAMALTELGGYLLDKRFEEVQGVPDEHISQIEGMRDILLRAVRAAPALPEAHYHLARYYNRFGNVNEERQTLRVAVRAFDDAPEESTRRTGYRLDTQRRYAQVLINDREFFAAEEQLVKGINIYGDAVNRHILTRNPEFGRLYADLGDLEYFTKPGNMARALEYYARSEQHGWAPSEIQYRMGSAYYYQRQWAPALERFFIVSSEIPLNRRLLHALGNASYMRGNYFAAQGYFNRLLDLLDAERARFPTLMPDDRPEHLELAERMMVARNNLAVTLEALSNATGNASYRSRALGLYAESARAWDSLTRNPESMIRAGTGDLSTPGINLAFLNSRNTLYPEPGFEPQLYMQIDKDVLEPSPWEDLVPVDYHLSDVVTQYR